jgi:hypothetical protein
VALTDGLLPLTTSFVSFSLLPCDTQSRVGGFENGILFSHPRKNVGLASTPSMPVPPTLLLCPAIMSERDNKSRYAACPAPHAGSACR